MRSPVLSRPWNDVRLFHPCFHNCAAATVAPDVDGSPAHIEYSVNRNDDSLSLQGQTNRLQHNRHHHKASVRNSSRSDTRN